MSFIEIHGQVRRIRGVPVVSGDLFQRLLDALPGMLINPLGKGQVPFFSDSCDLDSVEATEVQLGASEGGSVDVLIVIKVRKSCLHDGRAGDTIHRIIQERIVEWISRETNDPVKIGVILTLQEEFRWRGTSTGK